MRPRWIILGLFLASIAFGVVQQWPVRPMWMRPVEQGATILGFRSDRNSVVLLEQSPTQQNKLVFLVEKDVETGNELGRLQLPIEENCKFGRIAPLPGMKQLFVVYRHIDPAKGSDYDENGQVIQWPQTYRILDARSLAPLAGSFPLVGGDVYSFSRDGKWFWCYNPKTPYGHDVIESATGKIILSFPEQPERRPIHISGFSPDSKAIAMHWYHKTGRHEIEVYDLPTGRKRFSHLLPSYVTFNWIHLSKWDGDRIVMAAEALVAGTRTYQQLFFSFPVLPDRLGEPQEESQLTGYSDRAVGGLDRRQFTQEYGDRFVQVTTMPSHEKPAVLQNVLAWFDKTIGTKWSDPSFGSMHLGFFDRRTGKPLYDFASPELAVHRMGGFIHDRLAGISPDGGRVASVYPVKSLMVEPHPLNGLMMWDANPFPRWPWALAASLGTLVLILLLGRWRSKRLARARSVEPERLA